MIKEFFILMLFSTVASAATWDQLPLAPSLHGIDPRYVTQHFARLHPWKPGAVLPLGFENAGLKSPVRLFYNSSYLDGGSRVYLFQGANRKYLMLCTDAAFYGYGDNKIVNVDKPQLFLAATHFTDKNKVVVPLGSATEQFLLAAIKSEVGRITGTRRPGERAEVSGTKWRYSRKFKGSRLGIKIL